MNLLDKLERQAGKLMQMPCAAASDKPQVCFLELSRPWGEIEGRVEMKLTCQDPLLLFLVEIKRMQEWKDVFISRRGQ